MPDFQDSFSFSNIDEIQLWNAITRVKFNAAGTDEIPLKLLAI